VFHEAVRLRNPVLTSRLAQFTLASVLATAAWSGVPLASSAAAVAPPGAAAYTNTVFLDVRTARASLSSRGPGANQAIPAYHWLLNLDNTGDPASALSDLYCHPSTNVTPATATALHLDPLKNGRTYVTTASGYPQGCEWPSIRYAQASPVLSEGTEADWNRAKALPVGGTLGLTTGLPNNCPTVAQPINNPCRYLLSVTANGYQIGGVHFQVPSPTSIIKIFLNPGPIPLGTIRIKAFQDTAPTDGTYEESTERPLVGFHGIVNDFDGIVQADYFGNPLCTEYLKYRLSTVNNPAQGLTTNPARVGKIVINQFGVPIPLRPTMPAGPDSTGYYNPTVPGVCRSDSNGDIVIPNMAPNHYMVEVTPPIGAADEWIQTTTLEGNHDFDVWIMPNDTGYDSELVVGGEPVPFVLFGFVSKKPAPSSWVCPPGGAAGLTSGCGRITGQLYGTSLYQPGMTALPGLGGLAGTTGVKLQDPIDRGWVSLNSLNSSAGDFDQAVATIPTQDPNRVGLQYPDCPAAPTHANPSHAGWGCFEFSNVPDGEYMLAIWDEPQEAILDAFNVSISNGQIMALGVLPLSGWFSHIFGKVCMDTNQNGRCDPGEKGVSQADVQNLNRTNNAMVGGINISSTDNNGYYDFKEAYPLGLMSINQYFVNRWKTVGITFQACNDPKEHTIIGPMVDVSYLPQLGQCGRLDWAITNYTPATGDNGAIVATQIYDEIRQKYNARQAQSNDYQTGIPGFDMQQFTPVKGTGPGGTDHLSGYALQSDGSFCTVEGAKNNPAFPNCGDFTNPLLSYITENNGPPAQCYPMDANGKPIGYVAGQVNSFDFLVSGGACIESAVSGTQIGLGTDGSHSVQTVDGNYGVGNPYDVPAANLGDVIVKQHSPVDTVLPNDPSTGLPRPLYKAGLEEDVNMFSSTQYVPQGADTSTLPWPAAVAEPTQMPNDLTKPDGGYDENPHTTAPGPDPICAGTTHTVRVNEITGTGVNTPVTLTDATKHWGIDQLVGRTVTQGDYRLFVTSNTATTLTGAGGWYNIATGATTPPSSGPYSIVINPDLMANGGSPFEGTVRHGCDTKLLSVHAGQSIAPNFHAQTIVDVPLPAHFWGYIVDDLSVETSLKSTNLGGVHGLPNVPVGIYDWSGRRAFTVNSDSNGVWEVLMPSADVFNCPTPAQMCPNVYRFVGNDPGQPGSPNLNHNPNYRTISATFEAWPNMLIPADTAPTRATTGLLAPGAQFSSIAPCGVKDFEPQLFSIGPNPFVNAATATLTLTGAQFGTQGAQSKVHFTPDGGANGVDLQVGTWSDQTITVTVGRSVMPAGAGTLSVTNGAGLTTTNGVAFHVLGNNTYQGRNYSYNPHLVVVGPGRTTAPINGYAVDFAVNPFQVSAGGALVHPYAIQDALDYAASHWRTNGAAAKDPNAANNQWLVVVYPHYDAANPANPLNETAFVPQATYFENVIIHSPLQLQGVGPGGIYSDGTVVQGSIIDGRFWSSVTPGQFDAPVVGNPFPSPTEPALIHWVNLLASLATTGTGFTPNAAQPWSGDQFPGEGAVITVLGTSGTYPNLATNNFRTGVNGLTISGGDQAGFPGNLSNITGLRAPASQQEGLAEAAGGVSVQGGGVFVVGGTDRYKLTDNMIKQNSGTYGSVRFGSQYQVASVAGGAAHNLDAAISNNVFVADGGTNLAGALGLFDDTQRYMVDHNIFCNNVSAEYGGAISHFGYSNGGSIQFNRIFLNTAYDEGGAITIASNPGFRVVAGAVVPDPAVFTQGTGSVNVEQNYITDNLAQDDGGAFRIMGTAGTRGLSPISIRNNVIANNVSLHEGGAISLHDAPVVDIINDSITQNVTTATAVTSNGLPSPAGIAVDMNSEALSTFLGTNYANQAPSWMGTSNNLWPGFSNARIENDILWYNRAGSWAQAAGVAAIGLPGDPAPINFWDVGSNDTRAMLTVKNSLIGSAPSAPTQQYTDGGGNVFGSPKATGGVCSNLITDPNSCAVADYNGAPRFVSPYSTVLSIVQMRTYFRFRPAAIVSTDLPPDAFARANYWIATGSQAANVGANPMGNTYVPVIDIENNSRPPAPRPVDAGAYQVSP